MGFSVTALVCIASNIAFALFPVPPQIVPFDFGEGPVNSGEFVSVGCSVHIGDLPIDITWYHNNRTVVEVIGVTVMKNKKASMLSIDSVSSESAGEYTCVAKNRAGSASHSAVLNVNGTLTFLCFCMD